MDKYYSQKEIRKRISEQLRNRRSLLGGSPLLEGLRGAARQLPKILPLPRIREEPYREEIREPMTVRKGDMGKPVRFKPLMELPPNPKAISYRHLGGSKAKTLK